MTANLWLAIALAALVLASVFATLHLSLREISRSAVEGAARRSGKPGPQRRIARILDDLHGHAVALSLPRVLFTMLFVVGVVRWIAAMAGKDAAGWGEISLGVVASALIMWILGVVVPISIAQHAGVRTTLAWSGVMRGIYWIMTPVRRIADVMDEIVRRLAGPSNDDPVEVIEAEIRSVVEEGEREGKLEEGAGEMVAAVVEFANRTVEEIMTPRTEIEALQYTDDLAAVLAHVTESGHSRIPVYREDLDHIVGLLYAKDLLHWMAGRQADEPFRLESILRLATFVPETKTVSELLAELTANRVHIAIAADEYGGTAGLVTIEDMVEEVFGEIADEYDVEEDEAPALNLHHEQRAATIDARKRIDDANDDLADIGISLPESEDYDTIGGFVTVTLGRIPQAGETFRVNGAQVTVLEAEATRVTRVRVEHAAEESEPAVSRAPDAK
ncbi:MAG: HlyC/CorC family transporter [Phycisphaeraceae bacterium]|nr:HlyC/CorC family transporter [Phycisphaeraceae bacterium]